MVVLVLVCWQGVHAGVTSRWLSEITGGSSLVDLLSCRGQGVLLVVLLLDGSCDVVPYEIVGGRLVEPEGPAERLPTRCEIETTRVGVHICPSARQPVTMIGNEIGGSWPAIAPDRHHA